MPEAILQVRTHAARGSAEQQPSIGVHFADLSEGGLLGAAWLLWRVKYPSLCRDAWIRAISVAPHTYLKALNDDTSIGADSWCRIGHMLERDVYGEWLAIHYRLELTMLSPLDAQRAKKS